MNKQMVANAHLMAAAPEMAEALIVFVEANKKQLAHTPADIALAVVALEKAGWKP